MRRSPGLPLSVAAVLVGGLALIPPDLTVAGLRVVAALLLVCVLPGYALVSAMFPRSELGTPERILCTFGLSLATAVLGGFVLNGTPWGLGWATWTIWLSVITIGAAIVARARGAMRVRRFTPLAVSRSGLTSLMLIAAAALLLVATFNVSVAAVQQWRPAGFTQLWMLPGEPGSVRVGVESQELATATYRLEVTADEQPLAAPSYFALAPGQIWEATLEIPGASSPNRAVLARLYVQNEPTTVYREATLWR